MAVFHGRLIYGNLTTNEYITQTYDSGAKSPFDMGPSRNCKWFFMNQDSSVVTGYVRKTDVPTHESVEAKLEAGIQQRMQRVIPLDAVE